MVLSGATQKIQTIIELAEELYERVTELREQVIQMQTTVEETNTRVQSIERELAVHRTVLEAIADDYGIDPESVEHEVVEDDTVLAEDEPDPAVTSDDP